jgi:hypothetical protein
MLPPTAIHTHVSCRERQLLSAGLQAFRLALTEAREQRRVARVAALGFAGWRRLAASSARHWEYEAARQHRRDRLLRLALHAWRTAAEATADHLAGFWAVWQVEAPLRRALLGWHQAVAAARADRVMEGMAEVHCERRLQRLGLQAFASNAAGGSSACSPGSAALEQQQQRQMRQRQHSLTVPQASRHAAVAALPHRPPAAGRQQQQQVACLETQLSRQATQGLSASQRQQQSSRTTIVISRSRTTRAGQQGQQEQQAPAQASNGCSSASASQGAHDALTDWRAAADFWRHRHATFAWALGQQHVAEPVAVQAAATVRPQTAATLSELRAQWQGHTIH